MSAERAFDVAIAGGALVGAALARGLRGARVALIAQEHPATRPDLAGYDARVYAISPGNAEFLSRLGVWGALPQARASSPVAVVDVGRGASPNDVVRRG